MGQGDSFNVSHPVGIDNGVSLEDITQMLIQAQNPNMNFDASNLSDEDKFIYAGGIQSDAATQGANVQSNFLQQAIQQLQQFGGYNSFMSAGNEALTGLQEGSTIGGFDDRINQIMGGSNFQGLVDERQRGLQSQLASSGLRRSGTALNEAAAIPLDVALGIEGSLTGRQSNLAGMGLNATGGQFNIEQLIAQLTGNTGAVRAGGITGSAEAEASGILGELGFQQQQDAISSNNRNNDIALAISAISAFSDPRLKKNIRKEGEIGGLDLVRWEWIDEVKNTIVDKCNTFGFLSTQVKELYPDCVGEFGGYDVVNYGQLIEELKCHS